MLKKKKKYKNLHSKTWLNSMYYNFIDLFKILYSFIIQVIKTVRGDPNAEAALNPINNGLSTASISSSGSHACPLFHIVKSVFALASSPLQRNKNDFLDGVFNAVIYLNNPA